MTPRAGAIALAAVLLVMPSARGFSQDQADEADATASRQTASFEPRPEDVASLDAIIAAFYDVISGPAGRPRQWDRDRSLYIPGVRFVAISARGGEVEADVMEHADFVEAVDEDMVRDGFFEREVNRVTRSFGNLTHVFSTYEMRISEDGPVIGRGVNSLQLFHDGERWWIAGAVWDGERPDNPIPPELLPE